MNWLTDSPLLILAAVAVTSFLESFALVGLLVPGVVVLFSLMAVASRAEINLFALLIAGAAGGFIGDVSSFLIGSHLQGRMEHWSWLRRHNNWMAQGHWFIEKWGWLSVIIGRFLGPIRPVVPLIAGTLGMRHSLFISLSGITVLFWAPVYLLPGYYTGELSELWQVQPLGTRSLIIYLLTSIAISGGALAIYHHTHPHRWHLKGWLTAHQAERWPISATFLLICSLTVSIGVHFGWPANLDVTFQSNSILWRQAISVPQWWVINDLTTPVITIGCASLCIVWLLIAEQLKLAALFTAGAVLLWRLATSVEINTPEVSMFSGLAILIYTSGFAANLINHRVAALKKWPVYFITSQWIALLITSHIWEGTLKLSEALLATSMAFTFNSLVRMGWQALHLPQRLPSFIGMLCLIILGALGASLLLR